MVAVFTKFDDLLTQVFDFDLDDEENRQVGERALRDRFETPLSGYKFPPKAYVRVEGTSNVFLNGSGNWLIQFTARPE